MSDNAPFADMLTGGHPNSLGRTVEVVEMVLADPAKFDELFQCYFSDDEVVRLRTSNAMKRLWRERPELVVPYIERFLNEIAQIDQPSTQWTCAQLFFELDAHATDAQRQQAAAVLQRNLTHSDDWIVITQTLHTLGSWAKHDHDLRAWLQPHLRRFSGDRRKSVANTASKWIKALSKR